MDGFPATQLDSFIFFKVLALVTLGTAALVLGRASRWAWSRFAAAAFFLGLHALLELLSFSLGYDALFGLPRLLVAAAAYGALFEFGRRVLARCGGIHAGWLVWTPLLLFCVAGGIAAWMMPGWEPGCLYAIGIMTALWGGLGLWLLAREAAVPLARRLLQCAAVWLLLFALIGGLATTAIPFMPASWLNTNGLIPFVGLPIQLFRAISASCLALYVILALMIEHTRPQEVRPATSPLARGVALGAVCAIALAGAFWAWRAGVAADRELRANLEARTRTAVAALDAVAVAGLDAAPGITVSVEYRALKAQLRRIRESNPDVRFVYLLRWNLGKVRFLVDAEPDSSRDWSPPGQVYEEASSRLTTGFFRGEPFTEGPYIDRWGEWVSGHAPLPRVGGQPATMLGIDIDAHDWRATVTRRRLSPLLVSLAVGLIALGLFAGLHLSGDFSAAILASQQRLERLNKCMLGFQPDPLANIHELTAFCGRSLGADLVIYSRWKDGRLLTAAQWSSLADPPAAADPKQQIEMVTLARGGEDAHLIEDLPRTPYADRDPRLRHHGLRNYVGCTARSGTQPVGVLAAFYRSMSAPPPDDLRLVGLLAAAIAVEENRRRDQEELRASEARYRSVVESVREVVFIADAGGCWTYLNPAWQEMTGFPAPDSVGHGIRDFLHPSDQPVCAAGLADLLARHTSDFRAEVRFLTRSGATRWVELAARISADHSTGGTIAGILRDVTEQRQSETELRKRDALLHGLASATNHLLVIPDFATAVQHALTLLGTAAEVDRVYVFENHPHPETGAPATSQRYEWASERATAQIGNPDLQNLDFRQVVPRWHAELSAHRLISGSVRTLPAEEHAILEAQDIKSLLVVPIHVDQHFWGFIGFDDCRTERVWAGSELSIMQAAAVSLGGALKRRQAEAALQASELRNCAILGAVPDLMLRVRATGELLDFQAHPGGAAAGSPATPQHLHGLQDVLPAAVLDEGRTRLAACLRNHCTETFDYHVPDAAGGLDFEARFAVCGEGEALLIVRDITERKRLERDLLTARGAAEDAARAKSDFLASMSHELRTPMNAVIGLTGLLLKTPLTAEQLDYLQTISSSGEALLAVINDILDFSKIEAGKMRIDAAPFDLLQAVERTVEMLAERAWAKEIELTCALSPALPATVRGDEGHLRQVLINLVANAIKFTDRGEVTVQAAVVEETPGQCRVRFEVSDTGIGISPAGCQQLFEAFTQVDRDPGRPHGGTGLGLAICRRLVELMGGEIGCSSQLGQGSRFWIVIPLGVEAPPTSTPVAQPAAGRRILAADRRDTGRRHLADLLRTWGAVVDEAGDAATALDRLRHASVTGRPYDLALLGWDLSPAGEAGILEPASVLLPPGTRAVVLLVPYGRTRAAELLNAEGLALFLTKPVKQAQLAALCAMPPPALQHPAATLAATALAPPAAPTADEPSLRVLLAEDNRVNTKVTLRQLAHLHCTADAVGNGREAVERLCDQSYDVVLMDCQMPEMDGYEATRRIRAQEGTGRHTLIVAMTAFALEGDRDKCRDAGMDDYIAKPVRLQDLERVLKRCRDSLAARAAGGQVA